MAFLIGGANSAAATGGYEVANSCRFNDADSAILTRTLGTPTNVDKWTFSAWIKWEGFGGDTKIFSAYVDGSNFGHIQFTGYTLSYNGTPSAGTLTTSRVFRDVSAWYNIQVIYDSGNSTEGDRIQIWVNGVRETSFSTETYPSQNQDGVFNSGQPHGVGGRADSSQFWGGYMAEVVFCDGQAYDASNFGEFDEDSPTIWKPKDVSGLTFGNNGFYLDFEDSANLGNDANGGTDWSEANLAAADQATDTPTNNFCTLNSINPRHANLTMSEGNCALASTNAQWLGVSSTMAVSRGKWYAEWKYISGHNMKFGIVGNGGADVAWLTANVSYGGYLPVGYEYQYNHGGTGYRVNNNVSPSWSNGSFSSADSIIMMAFDADAGKIWWGRNGTWFNNTGTANPATGTDASTSSISSDNAPYIISCALEGNGSTGFVNFGGCPAFAISSAVADGDGYGAFEYAPPSGFFSICTKNLAEYG